MNGTGIIPYGLAADFCEECGRAKINRLLAGIPTGCKTCDDVITRHRCTSRPSRESLDPGESWECPACGSIWTAIEVADSCGECGQEVWRKTWETVEGDRIDTAPRYEPYVPVPFRNLLHNAVGLLAPRRYEKPSFGTCYQMGNGSMVHVKPSCRCLR